MKAIRTRVLAISPVLILSLLLLLALSGCGSNGTAREKSEADPNACGENLTWTITEDGTLSVS